MTTREGRALVVDVAVFGEKQRLVTLFSEDFGTFKGLVRGLKKPLQPMDCVSFDHYRRLENQLGTLDFEVLKSGAKWWFLGPIGAHIVAWLAQLCRLLVHEEQVYGDLWQEIEFFLDGDIDDALWQRVAGLEMCFLHAVGFGLPLTSDPVVAGPDDNSALCYVSPKTGRAVSATMGAPFANKLFVLPELWGGPKAETLALEQAAAFTLTGAFLKMAVYHQPLEARAALVDKLIAR